MQFVLDPLYKIFSCVIGEETKSIEKMLAQFKIKLKSSVYGKDIKPLLTDVCTAVFGSASGLTEMLATHIPSSKRAAQSKVEHLYLGPPVRYRRPLPSAKVWCSISLLLCGLPSLCGTPDDARFPVSCGSKLAAVWPVKSVLCLLWEGAAHAYAQLLCPVLFCMHCQITREHGLHGCSRLLSQHSSDGVRRCTGQHLDGALQHVQPTGACDGVCVQAVSQARCICI
jgi:hypothetical protein